MNISKYTLRESVALPSARALGKAQFALGKDHLAKNGSTKAALPSVFCRALDKAFAESAKLEPKKTRKNANFYPKKWNFF